VKEEFSVVVTGGMLVPEIGKVFRFTVHCDNSFNMLVTSRWPCSSCVIGFGPTAILNL